MEELKKAMLNFIDARERKDVTDRKILRRLTVLVVGVGLCTIMLLSVLIYLVNRPVAASVIALKNFENLTKTILVQRKFNDEDRKDIALARTQYITLLKQVDSMLSKYKK